MPEQHPQIGLWGPEKAGKTAYLAALYLKINALKDDWRMLDADASAKDFVDTKVRELTGGRLPVSTQSITSYRFNIYRPAVAPNGETRHYDLSIFDSPGGWIYEDNGIDRYFEQMRGRSGLLCLLNPNSRSPGSHYPGETKISYFELIQHLTRRLGREQLDEAGRLRVNLAVCVSKVDLDRLWPRRNDPEGLGKHVLGEQAYTHLINHCDRKRLAFFAISTVGQYRTLAGHSRPNIEPAGDGYIIPDMGQWKPFHLREPLEWLLNRVDDEEDDSELPAPRRVIRRVARAGSRAIGR